VDEYVRLQTAEQALGISYSTIRRWIREGRLQALRLPTGQLRVAKKDVERLQSCGVTRETA